MEQSEKKELKPKKLKCFFPPIRKQKSENSSCHLNLMKISKQLIHSCMQSGFRSKHTHQSFVGTSKSPNSLSNSFKLTQNSAFRKIVARLPDYVFDPNQPTCQEKQESKKFLNKLKRNIKEGNKIKMIRTTDLNEHQQLFTKAEQSRLEVIDEFLERGFELPTNLYEIKVQVSREKKEENCTDTPQESENCYEDEISRIDQWGKNGNKENILSSLKPMIQKMNNQQKALQGCPLKKQYKTLKFQNRASQKVSNVSRDRKKDCDLSSGQPSQMKVIGDRIFTDLNKNNSLHNMGSTNTNTASRSTKKNQNQTRISQFRCGIARKYLQIPVNSLMTIHRKQALYECEVIKGVKEILTKRDYLDVEFAKSQSDSQRSTGGETFFGKEDNLKKEGSIFEEESEQEEIEKQLKKNRQRLRQERQRVIQKMKC